MSDLSGSVDGASSSLEGMGDSATNAAGGMGIAQNEYEQHDLIYRIIVKYNIKRMILWAPQVYL
ncbi:hypothetical protein [Bacillus sp. JJ722]|uniref:hypothetical protein n=1 Tax=Bacillus sp. JJ722 TaxID=3122973 RepID=UPI003000881B